MIGTLKKSNLIRGEKSEARAVISKEAAVSLSRVGMGIGGFGHFCASDRVHVCFGRMTERANIHQMLSDVDDLWNYLQSTGNYSGLIVRG